MGRDAAGLLVALLLALAALASTASAQVPSAADIARGKYVFGATGGCGCHTVPKQLVREAINNLLSRCDEVWIFGTMSLGVKVQLGIAKRLKKPLRFYDIADLPEQVYRISEKLAQEEGRD